METRELANFERTYPAYPFAELVRLSVEFGRLIRRLRYQVRPQVADDVVGVVG